MLLINKNKKKLFVNYFLGYNLVFKDIILLKDYNIQ